MRFPVRRWINRWNAYWFPQSSTLSLSISRIVVVAAQLFWFFPSLRWHTNLLQKNAEFIAPQVLISAISEVIRRDVFFTPSTFTFLYWATAAVGVLALVGLFTRLSVFMFALGSWIFIAHVYSYGDRHHPEAVFAIFLMTLAFAPSGDTLSLDALIRRRRGRSGNAVAETPQKSDAGVWPLKLVHVLLSFLLLHRHQQTDLRRSHLDEWVHSARLYLRECRQPRRAAGFMVGATALHFHPHVGLHGFIRAVFLRVAHRAPDSSVLLHHRNNVSDRALSDRAASVLSAYRPAGPAPGAHGSSVVAGLDG
jgi:hypothetical protein